MDLPGTIKQCPQSFSTPLTILGMLYQSPLTRFPTDSTCSNWGVMGWCSIAMNKVFSTIQMVMARSTKGSMTIKFTISFNLIQCGWHSQIRKVLANLYQQGGHFLWDSSNSAVIKQNSKDSWALSSQFCGICLYVLAWVQHYCNTCTPFHVSLFMLPFKPLQWRLSLLCVHLLKTISMPTMVLFKAFHFFLDDFCSFCPFFALQLLHPDCPIHYDASFLIF